MRLTATAHFTCVGATRAELIDWLKYARENGIQNIMALRGDPPQGQTSFQAVEGGLRNANELVALIRAAPTSAGSCSIQPSSCYRTDDGGGSKPTLCFTRSVSFTRRAL